MVTAFALFSSILAASAAAVVTVPGAEEAGAKPASIIEAAISKGAPAFNEGHVEQCLSLYRDAARQLLALPGDQISPMDRHYLGKALASKSENISDQAWELRRAFDRLLDNASFKPLLEAPLPEGFPAPSRIGWVIEKSYPEYRAASAEGGRGAFWSLFNHIQKNEVAMTAPVEMTLGDEMKTERMAFLYERTAQGKAGEDGAVRVADLPAVKVASVAMRGRDDQQSVALARQWIEAHLKSRGLVASGPWRIMGYNSPMVPDARRVWELQVPVKAGHTGSAS